MSGRHLRAGQKVSWKGCTYNLWELNFGKSYLRSNFSSPLYIIDRKLERLRDPMSWQPCCKPLTRTKCSLCSIWMLHRVISIIGLTPDEVSWSSTWWGKASIAGRTPCPRCSQTLPELLSPCQPPKSNSSHVIKNIEQNPSNIIRHTWWKYLSIAA